MKFVIVTGNQGDIGSAIERAFIAEGYKVIGIDLHNKANSKTQISHDLSTLSIEESYYDLRNKIISILGDNSCVGLINNAAIQILGDIKNLKLSDFEKTMSVNLIAPLALTKMLFEFLEKEKGNIINIGSIHSN